MIFYRPWLKIQAHEIFLVLPATYPFKQKKRCKTYFWLENTYVASTNSEEAVRICSAKYAFLKISQNSQENACTGISF